MEEHAKIVKPGENHRSQQVHIFLVRRVTGDAADPAELDNQIL